MQVRHVLALRRSFTLVSASPVQLSPTGLVPAVPPRLSFAAPHHDSPANSRSSACASSSTGEPEMCVIVDEQNRIIDSQQRSVTVKQRLLGRGAYVLVLNEAGELLVSKRTMSKDVYPGHLDVVIAGIVRTGEEYQDTAARELHEELGIPLRQAAQRLQPLGVFPYADRWCQVFGAAFKYVHREDPAAHAPPAQAGAGGGAGSCGAELPRGFELQAEEVEWVRWVPLQKVFAMLEQEQEQEFTPVGRHILSMHSENLLRVDQI